MTPMDHRNRGKLFGRGAEFLHVTVRRHRERVRDRNAEGHLVLLVATLGQRTQCEVGREPGHQAVSCDDQHILGETGLDRGRADAEHGRGGRAGDLQRVGECGLEAEIFAKRDAEPVKGRCEGVTGENAVDRGFLQPGVRDRLARGVSREPQRTAPRHLADRRLADADDRSRAAQRCRAHSRSRARRASSS
jgi:hypothetical protein